MKTTSQKLFESSDDIKGMAPLERLRLFCWLSIKDPTDWIDIEPLFDDVQKQIEDLTK